MSGREDAIRALARLAFVMDWEDAERAVGWIVRVDETCSHHGPYPDFPTAVCAAEKWETELNCGLPRDQVPPQDRFTVTVHPLLPKEDA